MTATEVALTGPRSYKRTRESAILLACAGGMVIAGTFTAIVMWAMIITKEGGGDHWGTWGARIFVPLSMMLIAIVLGAAAVLRRGAQEEPTAPLRTGSSQLWLTFAVLVLIHGTLAFLYCKPGTGSIIDTFTFQRDACKSLLHGIDPFGSTQANIFDPLHTPLYYGPGMVVDGRVQVGFQYPPLTLLWALPGYLLGDVRYSYILAVIISAVLLFAICPSRRGLWLTFVLCFSPVTYLVEFLCWTEPLVLMMLSATIYAAVKKRWWLPIALGLFLATKQYNFLALPFIGCFVRPFQWKGYWKLTGLSLAVGVATVLPFALWNFRGLWHDTVLFHLAQPFRQDAVSFAVPFPWMMKVGLVVLAVFIVWAVRVGMRSPAMFAAAYGVALLLFVSTNKQAFTNYYFLIGQVFFLAVAALPAVPKIPTHP